MGSLDKAAIKTSKQKALCSGRACIDSINKKLRIDFIKNLLVIVIHVFFFKNIDFEKEKKIYKLN